MEDFQKMEYEFQMKDIDLEIQRIELEIARLNLEKEKLNFNKLFLFNSNIVNGYSNYTYEQNVTSKVDSPIFTIVDQEEPIEEVKPRRLKKHD